MSWMWIIGGHHWKFAGGYGRCRCAMKMSKERFSCWRTCPPWPRNAPHAISLTDAGTIPVGIFDVSELL